MSAIRFQVMPPLAPDEYQELRDDIADRGVIEPIHVDEHGVVIDGHHRKRIADDLGIECPTIVHDDLDDAGKRSLAFTLNLKRRHLNREQRRALIAESLKADPQLSNREHARRTGASHNTVNSVRDELSTGGQIDHLDKRQAPDGKSYPASQPRQEPAPAPGFNPGDLEELNTPVEVDEELEPARQHPAMPKPEYTPEQLASKRQREANERAARYIENFAIAYATVYKVLQDENLNDILQLVTPDIRDWFTVSEKEMTWPTPM